MRHIENSDVIHRNSQKVPFNINIFVVLVALYMALMALYMVLMALYMVLMALYIALINE